MMRVLKNKAVFVPTVIGISVTTVGFIILLFISPIAASVMLLCCLVIMSVFLFSQYSEYSKLNRLCDDIDKILDGDDSISFDSYEEGDISLLKTEISKMTTRIREQNRALAKEKSFLQDSLADISHQLRTPLTSMSIILTMLRTKELSDEDKKRYIRDLSLLTGKTEWLIDTLLKLSSFEAEAISMKREDFFCKELLESATEPLMIMAELKDVHIKISAEEVKLSADFNWCCEAIKNIVKNSIEHSKTDSTIEITATENPLFVTIAIEGGNNKIAEKDFPHIFERFYKSDNVNHQGYGIGLALAKKIISAHDGVIKAENTDKGVRFTLIFNKN